MKQTFALYVVAATLLAAACRGGGDARPATFAYTPVPYTVVSRPPVRGTPQPTEVVAIGESGQAYIADEVLVDLDKSAKTRFERWANSLGFLIEIAPDFESNPFDRVPVTVKVPPGSVPEAIELIRKQAGVRSASFNYLRRSDI